MKAGPSLEEVVPFADFNVGVDLVRLWRTLCALTERTNPRERNKMRGWTLHSLHACLTNSGNPPNVGQGLCPCLILYPLAGIGRGRTPALHNVPNGISRDVPNL